MSAGAAAATPASDAALVAALLCLDAVGLGGAVVRSPAGAARDAWLRDVAALLPEGSPLRRLPLHVQDDRLLGGLDLAATLRVGRPMAQSGLLVESDGGIVIACMAERIPLRTAAHLAAVLDTQQLRIERQGVAGCHPARIGLIALDEGIDADERLADALRDRLAFSLDCSHLRAGADDGPVHGWAREHIADARTLLPDVALPAALREALCAAALALGVDSIRGSVLAVRAARAHAALHGRREADASDATLAARLVLLPRATVLPDAESAHEPDRQAAERNDAPANDTQPGPQDAPAPPRTDTDTDPAPGDASVPAEDRVLEAASAVLPPGLLALLTSRHAERRQPRCAGRAGTSASGGLRGRPDGVRPGHPREGARLSLIDTLRAAAPWQALRRRNTAPPDPAQPHAAVLVRREDFRVARVKQRSETTTVFAVDASGSSALHRLGEAKGAVELLLADCYVRRDSVSLIAFRGRSAQVLLPPTRSLVRARRSLAGLAGGGGTPLATAIDATLALAEVTRRRGRTPVAVLLTDGCANVALDGTGGRERAGLEALHSARLMRASGIRTLVLDTSPHPQPPARNLAEAMGAVYLPLPHADALEMSRVVRAAVLHRTLP
ncbi:MULTISPECIES: magnesium chelatase subunit D [unclassified Variovorax]|uniref:magnesium chelatase subunit D n=1 Tax=unclassified Variovorax TaxID=663243 RepID=UPI003F451A7A